MSRHIVTFNNEETREFATNYRRGPEYNATIQNRSGQSITITVSNLSGNRGEIPVYETPASGALVIADGDIGELNEPYVQWLLTAAAAATGSVYIVEAG